MRAVFALHHPPSRDLGVASSVFPVSFPQSFNQRRIREIGTGMDTLRTSAARTLTAAAAALALALAALVAAAALPASAQAATSAWPAIEANGEYQTKVGSYYFLTTYDGTGETLMWTTKDDTYGADYVETSMPNGQTFFKGSMAYYAHGGALYQYNFKTAKATKLKKLGADAAAVGAVWGSNVYVSYASAAKKKNSTRVYNTKTKKLSGSIGSFRFAESYGSYAVGDATFSNSALDARNLTLYKLRSKGVKKTKTLSKYGQAASWADGKLYYTSATNAKLNYVCLYRANADGSKAKQIGSWRGEPGDIILVHDITSTSCTLDYPNSYDCYQFIYRTNELIPY